MKDRPLTLNEILDLVYDVLPSREIQTIRGYFKEQLSTLWREGESFSGKRPLGNSDWMNDMATCLFKYELIEGELDEDGYLIDVQDREVDDLIQDLISEM